MSERHRGADERAVATAGPLLKVEEERRAAEQTTIAISQKHRRTPLRAAQRARFETTRVRESGERGHQLNCARVVETLKDLDERTRESKRRRKRSHAAATCVEIRSHVNKEISPGPV